MSVKNKLTTAAENIQSDKFNKILYQNKQLKSAIQLIPGSLLILIFASSLTFLLYYSLIESAPPGGSVVYTLENYINVITNSFYRSVIIDSFIIAVKTTTLGFLLSFPLAYYIAFHAKRKTLLLLLVILPIFTNIVIRTYAWMNILGNEGLLNYVLVELLNVLDSPYQMLFTENAVVVGLTYVFLPFVILPLYNSLNKIDRSNIEAAKDLGANPVDAFLEITLPRSLSGIISGLTIVFVLSFASYVTPILLGGQSNAMIANIIGDMFISTFNWTDGSALSIMFVVIVMLMLTIVNRLVGLESIYAGGDANEN